jgi:hypothetical protein
MIDTNWTGACTIKGVHLKYGFRFDQRFRKERYIGVSGGGGAVSQSFSRLASARLTFASNCRRGEHG